MVRERPDCEVEPFLEEAIDFGTDDLPVLILFAKREFAVLIESAGERAARGLGGVQEVAFASLGDGIEETFRGVAGE